MRAFLGLGAIGCNAWAVGIVRLGPVADGTAADLPSVTSANWDGGAMVFSWPLRADAALGEATWPTRRPKSKSPIKNMIPMRDFFLILAISFSAAQFCGDCTRLDDRGFPTVAILAVADCPSFSPRTVGAPVGVEPGCFALLHSSRPSRRSWISKAISMPR